VSNEPEVVSDQADPDDPTVVGAEPDVAPEPQAEEPAPGEPATPRVTSILPNNVKCGGDDFTLAVYGTNFTEDTKILLGEDEVDTEFVDATRVTTIVLPSEVADPKMVEVSVKGAAESQTFAFMPADSEDPNTYPDADSPIGGGPLV